MADEEQLAVLRQGSDAWNAWRAQNPTIRVDLDGANLASANLAGANLTRANGTEANFLGANLTEANLSRAVLSFSMLSNADLTRADLTGAHLVYARLQESCLRNSNLTMAFLRGVHLYRASLHQANLTSANLTDANLHQTDLTRANLENADLTRARLVETDFTGACLTGCRIHGVSAWNLKLDDAVQKDLIITPRGEPEITVDNLKVAQFIYLLLHNERIRHVIDTITSKVVLILGRFTPERKAVLDALREELRQHNYTPVVFDFEKPQQEYPGDHLDARSHGRFVIADLTDARSVLQELQAVVPTNPSVPVQPLILATQDEPGMFDYFREYRWMLEPYRYDDSTRLLAALMDRVIAPAELVLSKADPPRRPVR
jgi:uncharacterized protein YjbI with pentapeptide repeats